MESEVLTDKMKAVVEAAGEKWHSVVLLKQADMSVGINDQRTICDCGVISETWQQEHPCANANPSPTDLNALFALAEKLGLYIHLKFRIHDYHAKVWVPRRSSTQRTLRIY
jgi:hypothetical protein